MLVTDKPENLPTTNTLDKIPADLLGPVPAEIQLAGKTLKILEKPPQAGETIDLMIRLRVYDVGVAYGDNGTGEPSHYRKTKLIDCWLPSEPAPPNADEDQGALIDEDGEISEEAAGVEPDADEDDGSWDDDNVARPNFSDKS